MAVSQVCLNSHESVSTDSEDNQTIDDRDATIEDNSVASVQKYNYALSLHPQ